MNRPLILAVFLLLISSGHAADAMTRLDVFVSTGDNHFLGSSLPIDSPASRIPSIVQKQCAGIAGYL